MVTDAFTSTSSPRQLLSLEPWLEKEKKMMTTTMMRRKMKVVKEAKELLLHRRTKELQLRELLMKKL